MTIFNLPDKDELEIQMQKRISDLEKANQDLHAEILEHKRTEEALRESEKLFRTAIENSLDVISVLDLIKGRYVLVSPS